MEMIGLTKEEWYARLFERLGRSKFRSGFHLTQKDIDYIHEKGLDTIRQHARDFIAQREAPAFIPNDGKQTPMRGHPVFVDPLVYLMLSLHRQCLIIMPLHRFPFPVPVLLLPA